MKKTILVTGALGYLGPHVVDGLLARGHRVIAIDRGAKAAKLPSQIELFQCSLTDVDNDMFKATGIPDVCLHLAWRNGFNHNANTHMEDLSEHYTFLLRIAALGVKQIAVIGSVHEIGYFEGEVDESTPANPRSLYGIAKNALRTSLALKLPEHGVTYQWLRLFYILGDAERGQSVFSKILQKDKEGQAALPFTSGQNKFDFIAMDDLVRQIAATVSQTAVTGVIHCCSGHPSRIRDQIDAFIAERQLSIRPDYGQLPDRAYDSPAIWGNTSKIRAILDHERQLTGRLSVTAGAQSKN